MWLVTVPGQYFPDLNVNPASSADSTEKIIYERQTFQPFNYVIDEYLHQNSLCEFMKIDSNTKQYATKM